jgi:hypothetical protein
MYGVEDIWPCGGKAPWVLNLGSSWKWVASFTPRWNSVWYECVRLGGTDSRCGEETKSVHELESKPGSSIPEPSRCAEWLRSWYEQKIQIVVTVAGIKRRDTNKCDIVIVRTSVHNTRLSERDGWYHWMCSGSPFVFLLWEQGSVRCWISEESGTLCCKQILNVLAVTVCFEC